MAVVLAVIALGAANTTRAFADRDCPGAPPPAVRDLALHRYYEDAKGSVVDAEALARHKDETSVLTRYVGTVSKLADRAHRQRSSPAHTIDCALTWLGAWAKDGAYLGTMATKQAEAQRRWDLAGLALAYLKLKSFATPEQQAAIAPWLRAVADAAGKDFAGGRSKHNNHWYWMGLGLGAVGLATDSDSHWQQAMAILHEASEAVGADGTLPLELERGARALHYHAFALMPLLTLAELAAARGQDAYAWRDGALHRLIATTVAGLNDPATFDKLAGTPQERPVKPSAGWLAHYQARFPQRALDMTLPTQAEGHRWLGGESDVLRQVLSKHDAPR